MSAVAFLIAVAISAVATLVWAAITGTWSLRAIAGMFVFGLLILFLPSFIHA